MTLSDIIALAKQGYKPSDIKELMQLSEGGDEPSNSPTLDNPVDSPKEDKPDIALPNDKPDNSPTLDKETDKPETPETDYKKLYEESQATLAEIQKTNLKKDVSKAEPSIDDMLENMFREYM